MKKGILALILILSSVFCVFGQNSGPIDLVLILDTSTVMGSSYEKVNDYITGSFLSEFLRTGDTFHLITFSASPRLDIARRISARGDVETIIGRMLIQYPIETGNNAGAAVNYVDSYIATLPPRPKKIVMVSAAGTDTSSLISSAKQRFSSKNATFDFITVTDPVPGSQNLSNPPGSGRSYPRQSSSQQGTPPGTTAVKTPPAGSSSQTSTQGGASSGTQTAAQGTTERQGASQTGTQSTGTQSNAQSGASSGTQTAAQGTTAQQGASQTGTQSNAQSGAEDTQSTRSSSPDTVSSTQGTAAQSQEPSGQQDTSANKGSSRDVSSGKAKQRDSSFSFNPTLPLILGIIGALLLLILIILFASRKLGSSPNRAMASASASPLNYEKEDRLADHSKDLASYAARQSKQRETPYQNRPIKAQVFTPPVINPSGPLLLNLFVEDQNTSIGRRNIHSLKSGYSLSVGGSKSDDFMIFLVPLPSHLGDIRRSGSQLTFVPRRPKYFPDIGTNEVRDCINKRIRVVSDKKYELWFSFVMYEDPLVSLNRVLHSIKVPG